MLLQLFSGCMRKIKWIVLFWIFFSLEIFTFLLFCSFCFLVFIMWSWCFMGSVCILKIVFGFRTKIDFEFWLSIVLLIYLPIFCFSKFHALLWNSSFHFLPASAKFSSYLSVIIDTASFKDSQNWFFTFSPVKIIWNLDIELIWKIFSCFYVLHTSHLFEVFADDDTFLY